MMTVTVGITAVQDTFGVAYARVLAGAVAGEACQWHWPT